jgi:hypothetical protein
MSISAFPTITPGFSFRPTSPFLAALAAAALRRLESPLTAEAAPQPIRPLSLGERGALLVVEAAALDSANAPDRGVPRVEAAFSGARAALADAPAPASRALRA